MWYITLLHAYYMQLNSITVRKAGFLVTIANVANYVQVAGMNTKDQQGYCAGILEAHYRVQSIKRASNNNNYAGFTG